MVAVGRSRNGLRVMADPFTVAAPAGARVRDRLRLSAGDVEVLAAVGEHLGTLARADLAERVRIGQVKAADTQRARRKKTLTRGSSSRWAGAITRASEDQYQLAMRAQRADVAGLRRATRKVGQRLAAPVGGHAGKVRGYATGAERWQKQRRLDTLRARLTAAESLRGLTVFANARPVPALVGLPAVELAAGAHVPDLAPRVLAAAHSAAAASWSMPRWWAPRFGRSTTCHSWACWSPSIGPSGAAVAAGR